MYTKLFDEISKLKDGHVLTYAQLIRIKLMDMVSKCKDEDFPYLPIIKIDEGILITYNSLPSEKICKIPEEVSIIDCNAFLSYKYSIGAGKEISDEEYYALRHIEKIIVHKNVKCLKPSCFGPLFLLNTINVSSDNPYYKDIDGVLYSKDGTQLLCYPAGRIEDTFIVPEHVKVIGENAFQNACVRRIKMPSHLKKIEDDAFWFSYVEEIDFLETTIDEIGKRIFDEAKGLTVYIKDNVFGNEYGNIIIKNSKSNRKSKFRK